MPGDFVARPVTSPARTIQFSFTQYSTFIDATEALGWMPSLAIGINEAWEVGFEVPVRYDAGAEAWTSLDPIPHVALKWLDRSGWQAAVRLQALIPATSDVGTELGLGFPFIWSVHPRVRVDAAPQVLLGLEEPTPTRVTLPLGVVFQPTSWLFAGVQAGPDVGLSQDSETAIDGHVLLGLTIQTRETAHLDLTARFFVENAGAGEGNRFSDGAGVIIAFSLFPQF